MWREGQGAGRDTPTHGFSPLACLLLPRVLQRYFSPGQCCLPGDEENPLLLLYTGYSSKSLTYYQHLTFTTVVGAIIVSI